MSTILDSNKQKKVSGLEVMKEAAGLLRGVRFRTEERVDVKGDLVTVSIAPRWNDNAETFRVIITCYTRAHQVVDWGRCRIVCQSDSEEKGDFRIQCFSPRGQAVITDISPGIYRVVLQLPQSEEGDMSESEQKEQRDWRRRLLIKSAVAAAAALVVCAIGWGGVKSLRWARGLKELTRLRQVAENTNQQYEQAWEALRFGQIVKPALRVISVDPKSRPNLVRVELSPRIEEGLVRDVSVCWGDAADIWEPIYEAEGTIKNFQVVHEYTLPPKGQTSSWILRVLYTVPDAVAAARRLTPEQLTSTCKVEATAYGVHLVPGVDIGGLAPLVAAGAQPEITWLGPASGAEVGWKTKVMLRSPSATERVIILVRPHPGATFYVQSGGHPLSANAIESFDVQLGAGRQQEIGKDFDILAVCSNNFRPNLPTLDMSDVPHSSVVARVTVTKTAGTIRMVAEQTIEQGQVHIKGEVWTSNGGALLLRQAKEFEVLETLPSSPVGSKFDKVFTIVDTGRHAVYLLVYKEDAPLLQVGQKISEISTDSYWLYEPAKKLNEK